MKMRPPPRARPVAFVAFVAFVACGSGKREPITPPASTLPHVASSPSSSASSIPPPAPTAARPPSAELLALLRERGTVHGEALPLPPSGDEARWIGFLGTE